MPQAGAAAQFPKFPRGEYQPASRLPSARSMPWCANSRATLFRRPALSSTTITIVRCAIISVPSPLGVDGPKGVGQPLIWINGTQTTIDPQRVGRESRSRAIGRRVSLPSRRSRDRKPAKELFWQLPIEWVRQRLRGGVLPCTFTHTGTKAALGIST
jgi:hypothetical protein